MMTETKQKRTYQKRSVREKESVAGVIALVKRVEELEAENNILRNALEEEHRKLEARQQLLEETESSYMKEISNLTDTVVLLKSIQNIPANIEGILYELIRARLTYWTKKSETENIDAKDELEVEWYPFREVFPKLA